MKERLLVTGGGGYIAAQLIQKLAHESVPILCCARRRPAHLLPDTVQICLGDVRDPDFWKPFAGNVDTIFHLAGQTSVYTARQDPETDFDINARPVLHLAKICKETGWRPKVVFASTVTIYGLPKRLPVDEDFSDQPLTIYDVHKQAAENYLSFYQAEGLWNAVSLRLANVYGPGPASSAADRGVLNLMMSRALEGKDLKIYGDGNFLRDYVYIGDVADAFISAWKAIGIGCSGRLIVASGTSIPFAEAVLTVARAVEKLMGTLVKVQYVEPPDGLSLIESRNFSADVSKIQAVTGWMPRTCLEDGIKNTLDFLRSPKER